MTHCRPSPQECHVLFERPLSNFKLRAPNFSDPLRVQEVRSEGAGPDPAEDDQVGKNQQRKIPTNLKGIPPF